MMTVMSIISGYTKGYDGVLSSEMYYRYPIQTVIQDVRCVLKVCAVTWLIGHKQE